MTHKGTKTIETDRLILRKFVEDDAIAAYNNWTSDDKVTEFLRWPTHTDMAITESIINAWIAESVNDDFYQWAIVLKELNEPIGVIGVVDRNESLNMLHIGYCIGSKWWHQGITSEALKTVMDFLFDEVGVNKIESRHDPRNPNSGAVMRKCGMQYEGTLRQADFNNSGIVDAAMYSLLRSDYNGRNI